MLHNLPAPGFGTIGSATQCLIGSEQEDDHVVTRVGEAAGCPTPIVPTPGRATCTLLLARSFSFSVGGNKHERPELIQRRRAASRPP